MHFLGAGRKKGHQAQELIAKRDEVFQTSLFNAGILSESPPIFFIQFRKLSLQLRANIHTGNGVLSGVGMQGLQGLLIATFRFAGVGH